MQSLTLSHKGNHNKKTPNDNDMMICYIARWKTNRVQPSAVIHKKNEKSRL